MQMQNKKLEQKLDDCLRNIGICDDEEYGINDHEGYEQSSGGATAKECLISVIQGFAHKIIDVDYYHSGGGFMHLMMQLESGHIITFHSCEHDIELSYNAWEDIDTYYDCEMLFKSHELDLVDYECGMGWETKSPYYEFRATNLITAYKCNPNFFKLIDRVCSKECWSPHVAIEEGSKHFEEQLDYVRDNIVNDWFQNFEESNKEMTDEYNMACDSVRLWNKRKEKLTRNLLAKQECEVGFQDCIEYSSPTIREAFKSRGFVDGTWRNSISPSFELWLDEESPISNDVLFVVYFPNLTEEDNPSELQDEQFNHYSIELLVSGDNVLDVGGQDWLTFDTHLEVLGFFYSNTKINNYTLEIDKEVK